MLDCRFLICVENLFKVIRRCYLCSKPVMKIKNKLGKVIRINKYFIKPGSQLCQTYVKFKKNRSSRPEVFCKKGVRKNFAKFTGKHLCQSFFFKKELLAKVFSCEFWEISNNTFFLKNTSGGSFWKKQLSGSMRLLFSFSHQPGNRIWRQWGKFSLFWRINDQLYISYAIRIARFGTSKHQIFFFSIFIVPKILIECPYWQSKILHFHTAVFIVILNILLTTVSFTSKVLFCQT